MKTKDKPQEYVLKPITGYETRCGMCGEFFFLAEALTEPATLWCGKCNDWVRVR